jgi:hypothetical protein
LQETPVLAISPPKLLDPGGKKRSMLAKLAADMWQKHKTACGGTCVLHRRNGRALGAAHGGIDIGLISITRLVIEISLGKMLRILLS